MDTYFPEVGHANDYRLEPSYLYDVQLVKS